MITKISSDIDKLNARYKRAFSRGGIIQKYIDETVLKDSRKYTPFNRGRLYNSAKENSTIGDGLITWSTPYARYVWEGKSKSGRYIVYNRSKSRFAGAKWAEKYKLEEIDKLERGVVRKVKEI